RATGCRPRSHPGTRSARSTRGARRTAHAASGCGQADPRSRGCRSVPIPEGSAAARPPGQPRRAGDRPARERYRSPVSRARTVSTSDGLKLKVYVTPGPSAEAPTVVLVHGYPDDHTVWDGVVAELKQHARVATYDVRGAGQSDVPAKVADYRLDQLSRDLLAVIDAVSPGAPVHLVAHDWGSIQAWETVTDPDARDRLISYTSISGPCLDHVARWMRNPL